MKKKVDMILVKNQMREVLGYCKNDEKHFWMIYQSFDKNENPEMCWEFFGKQKISGLAKTKKAFLKQSEKLELAKIAVELIQTVYSEELKKSVSYASSLEV